jgi:release factor glutamine methyltransferase
VPAGATARARLESAASRLAAAGIATARADAEWLLAGLLGRGRAGLLVVLDEGLPAPLAARFETAVARRARREPLQQVLGWEEFRGLRLAVTPDVLVPRPETELLVDWALALLPPGPAAVRPLVMDVGTGSGCIACAIAHERPDAAVVAVDRSAAALAVARANVARHGLAGRVRLVAGDLLGAVGRGRIDLIVANLPYLPGPSIAGLEPEVSRHEPRLALDGGPDGLDALRRLVPASAAVLRPGGGLALETSGPAQAAAVAGLAAAAGFVEVAVRADLAGVGRFVAGRRAAGGV